MRKSRSEQCRSQEARERLREAARVLFGAHGYEAVGVREVGAYARINAAQIKHHFGSKRDLLNDVLLQDFAFAAGRLGLAVQRDGTSAAKLGRYIEALGEVARRRPWFPRILVRELMTGRPNLGRGVRARLDEFLQLPRDLVVAGRAAREFGEVNEEAVVLSLLGSFVSLALLISVSDPPAPLGGPRTKRRPRRPDAGHAASALDVESHVAHLRSLFEALQTVAPR
jgi:AcrR family transcriptional regulator